MTSAGAVIDQLLQSRRDVLLTFKEPRREIQSVHREKRLGTLEIPNQLLNSVQQSQRPLFISLDSRWEEMAAERQRKKKCKRTRSVYANYKGKSCRKRRKIEENNVTKPKHENDTTSAQIKQASELTLSEENKNAKRINSLSSHSRKETHDMKDHQEGKSDSDKSIGTSSKSALSTKETSAPECEPSYSKQKRKTTSRYSLQEELSASTKIQQKQQTKPLSLATAAKHALLYTGREPVSSALTLATSGESLRNHERNSSRESTELLSMTKQQQNNKIKIARANMPNKESNQKEEKQEQRLELRKSKMSQTRCRTELPRRKWTTRKLRTCLCKITKVVSLRRHWRVRDFVLCNSDDNKKSNKIATNNSNSSNTYRNNSSTSSTPFMEKPIQTVKAEYTALMLRRRREKFLYDALVQRMASQTEQLEMNKEHMEENNNGAQRSNHVNTDCNNSTPNKNNKNDKDSVRRMELQRASVIAIHSFWEIVKRVLAQRQASLWRLLHSLQTTNNDHIGCTQLNMGAARAFPLFGALVKLEWVHYIKPIFLLNTHTRQRATLQMVKTQYGIVMCEMLRTLEVALLPTSRPAREALLNWLTYNNSNNTTCPAQGANTCRVTKLYLASSGTRGSAVKKMSNRLRSYCASNINNNNKNINRKLHVDVMCSYVGEVECCNVIDKVAPNYGHNDAEVDNSNNEKSSSTNAEHVHCEQHGDHVICNSANLLDRLRHRYL